jgi:hypothetical protein
MRDRTAQPQERRLFEESQYSQQVHADRSYLGERVILSWAPRPRPEGHAGRLFRQAATDANAAKSEQGRIVRLGHCGRGDNCPMVCIIFKVTKGNFLGGFRTTSLLTFSDILVAATSALGRQWAYL